MVRLFVAVIARAVIARAVISAAVIASLTWAFAGPVVAAPGGGAGLTYIVPVSAESNDGQRTALPDLMFADASGMPRHLKQFSGQVLIINFWSMSCGPCLKDLLYLDRIQGDYGNFGLSVLDISEDNGGIQPVRAFLSRQKYNYLRAFLDPDRRMAAALGITTLPTSIIVDRHFRQIQRITGSYPWDQQATAQRL